MSLLSEDDQSGADPKFLEGGRRSLSRFSVKKYIGPKNITLLPL
jgi:hypothetical protein